MAHKKAGGSTRNGRDSNCQYRGVKVFGGQFVTSGSVIVRQVGCSFHAGVNVARGKDHTLFALVDGNVHYRKRKNDRRFVSVVPKQA